MEFRDFEKLGVKTSLLGFGCMRYPVNSDGSINEEMAERMIDTAYKAGINYFDTAYPYHGGNSEIFTGKALDKYDRSSYYLATKLPVCKLEKEEDEMSPFKHITRTCFVAGFNFHSLILILPSNISLFARWWCCNDLPWCAELAQG